jgi:hypothetical protein
MHHAIAQQIDRAADLALAEASRGSLPLSEAVMLAESALSAWRELGGEFWPEVSYWVATLSFIERNGKAN